MADDIDLVTIPPDIMIRDRVFGLYGLMLRLVDVQDAGWEIVYFLQLSRGNDHRGAAVEAWYEEGRVGFGILCRSWKLQRLVKGHYGTIYTLEEKSNLGISIVGPVSRLVDRAQRAEPPRKPLLAATNNGMLAHPVAQITISGLVNPGQE